MKAVVKQPEHNRKQLRRRKRGVQPYNYIFSIFVRYSRRKQAERQELARKAYRHQSTSSNPASLPPLPTGDKPYISDEYNPVITSPDGLIRKMQEQAEMARKA